eukprot:Gregarina_sp_Pseudo_9__1920@NODE_231_length_3495_cov_27_809028_g215_i0_p1_GENE_NODE_231_length_3495_cov_27_809028_g215_i0NODE_231_length_3495_cov_27_809028_g215_i0_p1_ORF_typecomplete_len1069_score328_66Cadherinlike/PF12733_7/0_0039Cadherinlike/PF12733_7/0_58Cadherinlike/PF12733_7/7_3e03_NODE_231_length_3495_cov_27_809028_g215_i02273433
MIVRRALNALLVAACLGSAKQTSPPPPAPSAPNSISTSTAAKPSSPPTAAAAASSYSLLLRNIHLSHGTLSPSMSPDVFRYTVTLEQPVDQVALVPEIDRSRPEYQNSEALMPIVTVNWEGNPDAEPEASAIAMKKQIDLPDDGSELPVSIKVQSPVDKSYAVYRVTFRQKFPPPTMLKRAEGYDDTGNVVLVQPALNQDDSVYRVFVTPEADKVSLTVGCNTKSALQVNGKKATNGRSVDIRREKDHHTQIVEVTCARANKYPHVPQERKYALLLNSDWPMEEITPPKLVVDDVGSECLFDAKRESYRCPDPRTDNHKTRLISKNEPSIKYVLANKNRDVEVRLLDRQPSIPFTYSNSLTLTAYAGQNSKSWPVSFSGTTLPSILQIFGWILALLLAILLFALLIVIGCANVWGLGVPLGATEIAATLTFIIQYLCFANFMRGSSALNDLVTPVKWVTLFWPLPWKVGDSLKRRQLLDVSSFSSAYGLELWGESSLGDVTDIRNACGCLFWSSVCLGVFMFLHLCVYMKFKIFEKDYTFPHRVSWGNWESRCLHWLAFPAAAGAGMILASDITTTLWKVLAGVLLAAYFIWISVVFVEVHGAINSRSVCWIWNSSVREDGSLEDESGYWMDVTADQLLTQPVNRSLCKGFFPYRWISTVADVVPLSLSQALFSSNTQDLFPPQKYSRAHKEAAYPLAKNPQVVEVVRTRAPGGPCKGQRLISGLLRSQWLDILFTYQGLTRFHSQIYNETGSFVVPLIVKTSQLSGPIASGKNAFFFDGARVPFIRIADFLYRLLVGIFVGIALASEGYKVDAAMFASIAILSLAFMIYVISTKPYSRTVENWLMVFMLGTVTLSAFSFVFHAVNKQDPSWLADIFLWVVAVCCFVLAAYSCVVTFSVFSALFCPPLEESRFLEKLANCNVTVSEEQAGWAFDVPAYSKFPVRDLKAQCTLTGKKRVHVTIYGSGEEPNLEFSARDLKQACRSGYLVPPVCTVFAPAPDSKLGYRQFSVTNRAEVIKQVSDFLASDHETRHLAEEVARHIAHQVEVKGRGKTILSVTVIPDNGSTRL